MEHSVSERKLLCFTIALNVWLVIKKERKGEAVILIGP